MQLLTPAGYLDLADLAIGDQVCAWEIGTGLPIVNTIEQIETITPEYFAYIEEGKRGWVQSYDTIDTWGRARNTPWAAGGKWYKLGALNDLGTPKLYEWAVLDPQTVTPTFTFYVINGMHRLFAHQSVWANGNVTHARDLKIGDILYDDTDVEFAITSIVAEEGAEWVRFSISGDSSYIADGLTLHNADRYWVGGSGNVSDAPNHWSASDGGAPGASAPTSTDNCHWTAASSATAYTMTLDASLVCADAMFDAAPSVSGSITVASGAGNSIYAYGSVKLLAGMTWGVNRILFYATGGTKVFTTNGVSVGAVTFHGSGGTTQLADNLTCASTSSGVLQQDAGAIFDPNGKTVTLSAAGSKGLNSAMTFYNLTVTSGDLYLAASITVTNTFTVTGTGAESRLLTYSNTIGTQRTITAAVVALTYADFMDILGAGTANWSVNVGAEKVVNGTFDTDVTGWSSASGFPSTSEWVPSGKMRVVAPASFGRQLQAFTTVVGQTYTASCVAYRESGTGFYLARTASNGGDINFAASSSSLTPVTLSFTFVATSTTTYIACCNHGGGAGTHVFDDVSIKPIAGATVIGDRLGNSGITFTPAQTNYFYAPTTGTKLWSAAGNWFLGSGGTGGAGRVPLPQDTSRFDGASMGAAGITVIADMPHLGKDIDWTGVTNAPYLIYNVANIAMQGSLTYAAAMGVQVNGNIMLMWGRGSHTITSAGVPHHSTIRLVGFGGTYSLGDAYTSASRLQVEYSNFNTNGYSLTVAGLIDNSNTTARTISLGASLVTITSNDVAQGIAPFSLPAAAVTLSSGTSTIKFTDATANAKTFVGGSKAYNNAWLSGAGSGAYLFTGSPTFADIKISDGAKTIKPTAGTTITAASWTGFEDNVATINTASGTGQCTLAKSGGGVVSMRGANVTNCIASPANTFYAGSAGVDGGNNVGWLWQDIAVLSGAAAAAAAASGALDSGIALAGVALSVAGAGGTLTTAIPLAAAAVAVSAADGILNAQITLAGDALAQAAAAAGLDTAVVLAGDAGALGAASGTLTVQIVLSGNAAAAAGAGGELTAQVQLSAVAIAQAVASGSLTTEIPLAAFAQAQASVVADFVTRPRIHGYRLETSHARTTHLISRDVRIEQ